MQVEKFSFVSCWVDSWNKRGNRRVFSHFYSTKKTINDIGYSTLLYADFSKTLAHVHGRRLKKCFQHHYDTSRYLLWGSASFHCKPVSHSTDHPLRCAKLQKAWLCSGTYSWITEKQTYYFHLTAAQKRKTFPSFSFGKTNGKWLELIKNIVYFKHP